MKLNTFDGNKIKLCTSFMYCKCYYCGSAPLRTGRVANVLANVVST